PYPYRRRRRRGDLTFLPGGGARTRATQTLARAGHRRPAGGFNHIIRGQKIVIYFFFFYAHV
ncbi:hypothetical protein, partial [Enterobacter intestinihominis]